MKNHKIKLSSLAMILLSIFFNLTGCSSGLSEGSDVKGSNLSDTEQTDGVNIEITSTGTMNNQDITIEKYEKLLTEWQEVKPSLKRLVAIESELSELIDYLNNLAQMPEKKQQVTNEKPAEVTISKASKDSSNSIRFSVQLAAVTIKTKINTTWAVLKNKHPKLLGSLETTYEKSIVNSKTYYRIKAGNFENKIDAKELCQQLSVLATPCLISKYKGTIF